MQQIQLKLFPKEQLKKKTAKATGDFIGNNIADKAGNLKYFIYSPK